MRKSKTLERLYAGKGVRMCCLGNFLPSFICHAAHFGFHCIWLDLEHRPMDNREVQALLAYCHLFDIDCVVRPSTLQPAQLYRYLEDGATGLMIPHVSTELNARDIVEAVKFPPLGSRGLDGTGLDSEFSLKGGTSYPEQANNETFLLVQIETPEAVENIQAIAAVNGIDGLFIGPADLGLRLSHSGTTMSISQAIDAVSAAAARYDRAWGCPLATVEEIQDFSQRGAKLISYGSDFRGVKYYLEAMASDFNSAEHELENSFSLGKE